MFSFACYIKHEAEGHDLKEHFHLYLEPNNKIQTELIADLFIEPLAAGEPLKCVSFKPSKFEDWYLYTSHNKQYLESRKLNKEYHYSFNDFKASDPEKFKDKVDEIDLEKIL